MAIETTPQRQMQFPHRDYESYARRQALARWILTGVVGVALGLFVVLVSNLPDAYVALLVLSFLCLAAAVIVGDPRRLFLAIVMLDIPFRVTTHLNYQNAIAGLGGLGGLEISITTLVLIFLYGLWFIELLVRRRDLPRRLLRASWLPILYVGFATLSLFVARDPALSFIEVFLLVELLLLYIYMVGTIRTREEAVFVVTTLVVGLLLESVLMIGLYFVRRDFSFAGVSTRIDYDPFAFGLHYRVGGTVGSPNTAGGYLSMLIAPAVSFLIIRLQGSLKWLGLFAFFAGMAALILTFSRGAWLATTISLVVFAFFAWRRGWLSLGLPLAIALVAILAALPFAPTIAARVFGNDYGAAASRLPLDIIAWRMIGDHPLLGIGANNYVLEMRNYVTPDLGQVWLYVAHNRYLLLWAEMGIGGFLAFVSFLVFTLRKGWQAWNLHDRLLSPLALALAAGLLGHMVHMLVEIFNAEQQQEMLFVVAALIVAISQIKPDPHEEDLPAAGQRRAHVPRKSRTVPGAGTFHA